MCKDKHSDLNLQFDVFFDYTQRFVRDFENLFQDSEYVSTESTNKKQIDFNDLIHFISLYSIFIQLVLGVDYNIGPLNQCNSDTVRKQETLRIFDLANCVYERINNIVYR